MEARGTNTSKIVVTLSSRLTCPGPVLGSVGAVMERRDRGYNAGGIVALVRRDARDGAVLIQCQ